MSHETQQFSSRAERRRAEALGQASEAAPEPAPATRPAPRVNTATGNFAVVPPAPPAPPRSAPAAPPRRPRLGPVRATIRGFGELCITFGVVLMLFVVWQLWWTDLEADRSNQVQARGLAQQWKAAPPLEAPADPAEPQVAQTSALNTAFGVLYIPRFGDGYFRTIAEGVSLDPVLNTMGVGHYPGSEKPGEVGNFAVAGHRVTYGKPFNKIAELIPGDEIVVQTREGFYTYTFRNFDITDPSQVSVLDQVPDMPNYEGKDRIMTLTACNPMFSARERYIAYAVMTEWRPAADGPPKAIADSKAYRNNNGEV